MKKLAFIALIVAFMGMVLASCNTYERCPAYTQADVEASQNAVV